MRLSRWAGLAVTLAVLVGGTWALVRNPHDSREAALAAFYGGNPRPECMAANPLERAGRAVVPLVIAELPNRSMRLRRYAIRFLGEGRYREALPALETILNDTTELDYIRGDALLAIAEIDADHTRGLAGEPANASGHLGWMVQVVLRGGSALKAFQDHSCGW